MADLKRYLTNPSLIAEGFFRQISSYSVFQNKSEFKVKVLTEPEHYSGPDDGDDISSKWWFKGRIMDKNMAHEKFLPDPCDESVASDRELTAKLVSMHSTVFSEGKPDCSVGDVVLAFIDPGDNNNLYDLQNLKFIKLETKINKPLEIDNECYTLSELDFSSADTVGSEDVTGAPPPAAIGNTLQSAYFNLERTKSTSFSKQEMANYIYEKMNSSQLPEAVILGIMANAEAESGLNEFIVSRASGESSLGLWQCNVGSQGKYEDKRSAIKQREAKLPQSIRLKDDFNRIPYFAGSLIYGKSIISTATYNRAQDKEQYSQTISSIYDKVTNKDNQIQFVIKTAEEMLNNLTTNKQQAIKETTAEQWADWWLVYFEQPGAFHSRGHNVGTIKNLLQK